MNLPLAIELRFLEPVIWFLLAAVGAIGVLAIVSPRLFGAISTQGGKWIDSSKFFAIFDKRIDVDGPVLRHSRVLGVAVVASVLFLGYTVWVK